MKRTGRKERDWPATETVLAIGRLNLKGHMIPDSWFDHIRIKTGKAKRGTLPDMVGLFLLAEVCYWYTPSKVMDPETQVILGAQRRFEAEKMQRSYKQWIDRYGFGKRQLQAAVGRLVEGGYIVVTFKDIAGEMGTYRNVMYVEPVPEKIAAITYDKR